MWTAERYVPMTIKARFRRSFPRDLEAGEAIHRGQAAIIITPLSLLWTKSSERRVPLANVQDKDGFGPLLEDLH
jgi:hypothetical protein